MIKQALTFIFIFAHVDGIGRWDDCKR